MNHTLRHQSLVEQTETETDNALQIIAWCRHLQKSMVIDFLRDCGGLL